MARTALTPTVSSRSGIALPVTAAAAVDLKFINDGTQVLVVGGACTVSLNIAKQVDGVTPDPKTVTILAGATKIIGPFPTDAYNQPGSEMWIDLDTTVGVTVGVVTISGLRQ